VLHQLLVSVLVSLVKQTLTVLTMLQKLSAIPAIITATTVWLIPTAQVSVLPDATPPTRLAHHVQETATVPI
jgi:hypothetical protein